MYITIRPENEKDYFETEYITREAFWDVYHPGCTEHLVLHQLRDVPAFVKELDFVVCDGVRIVGNVVCSKAKVINADKQDFEVLSMGPLAVLPDYQGKGIGGLLINKAISKARELGYKGIVIYGNPDYYHRFGFVNAEQFGIKTADGENFDYFMALELSKGSLRGITGSFHEDEAFNVNEEDLKEFDKAFPYKEKHVTATQLK
ncbi:MAG: N-acetyltransferase [Negativicutes bacterium]|nr:N-acetyltransferase [Negativicutes bacterium]